MNMSKNKNIFGQKKPFLLIGIVLILMVGLGFGGRLYYRAYNSKVGDDMGSTMVSAGKPIEDKITGISLQKDISASNMVQMKQKEVLYTATTNRRVYQYPDYVIIDLSIRRELPVLYANVECEISRPDGSKQSLKLHDDGLQGDSQSYDGIYTGIFVGFNGNGKYQAVIKANDNNGKAREGIVFSEVKHPDANSKLPPMKNASPFDISVSLDFEIKGWSGKDLIPPGRITTLRIIKSNEDWAILEWIAPGDNAYTGQAAQYDMRYANHPIRTEVDWEKAIKVHNLPLPKESGRLEQFKVTELPQKSNLFFAIRTYDHTGNISEVSNNVLR